jgi:hypothetical protein
MKTINKFYLKGGSIMLKKIDEVLFVVFIMAATFTVARTDMMTKELYAAQAYRESIESTVYTDTMNEEEILQKYFEYSGDGILVTYKGIIQDEDGEAWYSCTTHKGSSTYYSLYGAGYVNGYVNHKIQQEKLAEADEI